MIIEPSAPRTMHLEPGIYPVTCMGVRMGTLANPQFGSGEMVYLQLAVDNVIDPETHELATIERMCSRVWSPRSALWICAKALGYRCVAGEPIDTDHLIGRRCQAVVRDEVGSDGNLYTRVDTLVPLPQQDAPQGMPPPTPSPAGQPVNSGPVWQNYDGRDDVPYDLPPPPTPLRDQILAKAEQLAQQGKSQDDLAYPPLNLLTQSGAIDWTVFWQECAKRRIGRNTLCERLGLYDQELDDQLRSMMAVSVIDLLKGPVRP